ncbi:MAG: ankyrin repeat domain-containing protein [Deltaproteobacteria bacterium]|nr:ankyrin repeat domain-containing protein [Deltaproteobacteria bacterium]
MQRNGIIKRTFLFALALVTVLTAVHPAFLSAGEAEDTLRLEQAARKAAPAEFRNILAGIKNLSKRTLGAALLAACDGDNYNAIVPMLLDAGASPTFGEDRNNGALSKAVSRRIEDQTPGSLATVQLLLQRGATTDSANEMGYTPLMQAASTDDLELAELLISFLANPGFQNKDGRTALDMADEGPMRSLLEKATKKKLSLWDDPSVAAVKLLPLSGGGQGKFLEPCIVPGINEQNRQIMQQALFSNDIKLLRDIISDRQGANAGFHPDMDLEGGYRPLMLVQSAEAAKILLKHGANPSLSDAKGKTALHYAVMSQRPAEIVPVLLAAGADANARDSAGDTPLSLVIIVFIEFREVATGEQLLRQLVKAGADINSLDKWGDTLLHVAANNDNSALATAALALGADANVVNHSGDTPLAIAGRLNSRSVIRLLEKK